MEDVRALSRCLLAERQPVSFADEGRSVAAVLVLLYEYLGEEHILLQVRTDLVVHHKGEISLPGGARDAVDDSLVATALRETQEEIGVSPEHVEVFGPLDYVATIRSNFLIAPFVGAITKRGKYPFRTADREVRELLEVPLTHLRGERSVSWSANETYGELTPQRSFRYGEHLIWGATARILGQYLDLIAGECSDPLELPR